MKHLLKKLLFPAAFAILFTSLILLVYPLPFNHPFQLEVIDYKDYPGLFEYHDMDGDGESELLHTGYNNPENNTFPFVRILRKFSRNDRVLEQINLVNPTLPLRSAARAGDYDDDRMSEYYLFTLKDTMLYLEAFEYQPDLSEIKPFICREIVPVNTYKNEFDVAIYTNLELSDVNHDGYKEFIFIVNGLYSAHPRGVYIYDIHNDSLWKSNTQSIFTTQLQLLRHGDKAYIGAFTSTTHNQDPPLPDYHDHCGWVLLLDENLDMVFEPAPGRQGYGYLVYTVPIIFEGKIHALAYFDEPPGSEEHPWIRIYDQNGNVVMSRTLETTGKHVINDIDLTEGTLVIGQYDSDHAWRCNLGDSIILDALPSDVARSITTTLLFPKRETGWAVNVGIDQNDGTVLLLSDRLRSYARLKVIEKKGHYSYTFGKNGDLQVMALTSFQNTIFVALKPNTAYPFRWLYRAGIFLVLLAFFGFMQWAFNFQLRRQQQLRESLTQSQLALSKRQLEPHFMLNTLNNIGQMFTQTDKTEAQYYFGKYAALLRRGLMLADRVETTLEEELQFIQDYLVLQKQRFDGELGYRIEIGQGIDPGEIRIPHSLLYTFTENAIKHGLSHKQADRQLFISLSRPHDKVMVTIRDNGIGREQARQKKTFGTRQGNRIVDSIIEGYNRLYKRHVRYGISDLFHDDGSPAGTEVRVWV